MALQDAVDDDDDDEEEEEEDDVPTHSQLEHMYGRRHADRSPRLELPDRTQSRASPVSPDASHTADDKPLIDLSVYTSLPSFGRLPGAGNKVKVVRQLSVPQRTEWVGSA